MEFKNSNIPHFILYVITYLCWDVGIKVSACKMAPADVPVITLDSPQSQEAAVICHPVMSRHYTDRDHPIKIAGK